MLRFIFLGTSSGVPTLSRNVTALAVKNSFSKKWLLVDAGEGTQQRIQQARLSLHDLAVVCITHVHGDHCYGLPGLLASAGMGARSEPLTLIAPKEIWQWLQISAQLTDLHLPDPVHFVESSTLHEPLEVYAGVSIQSHVLHHRVPCHAFKVTAQREQTKLNRDALLNVGLPKGAAWGKLQQGLDVEFEGRILSSADFLLRDIQQVHAVIAGDNDQPELLTAACQNTALLIHEVTYTQAVLDKVGSAPMHSSATMLAEFAQSVALPNLILTHFSPRYHNEQGLAELCAEAGQGYQGKLFLAKDFDEYELTAQGVLNRIKSGAPWETPITQ